MKARELVKWREANGHSQQSLADALGFSRRQIIRYEIGQQEIPKVLELALQAVPAREGGGRWPAK
jgi:transcriptional regulator with XRE-family HTH domain